jgi:hypothetical protein
MKILYYINIYMQELADRNLFICEKYIKAYAEDKDVDLNIIKGDLQDNIDVDGLNLYDLRKSRKTSEEDYDDIEKLNTKRRNLMRELGNVKDQLQIVFKTETFNDSTGIGESKYGLPLGRLSVRVVSMKFAQADILLCGENPSVRLRVLIKGTRAGGVAAGPPVGPRSYSSTTTPQEGNMALNQSLGII